MEQRDTETLINQIKEDLRKLDKLATIEHEDHKPCLDDKAVEGYKEGVKDAMEIVEKVQEGERIDVTP